MSKRKLQDEKPEGIREERIKESTEGCDDDSDWTTISDSGTDVEETRVSTESEEQDSDNKQSKSKLRVEKEKKSEPPQALELEPEEEKKAQPKRPSVAQLKINPKNYVPPNKGERTEPSTLYTHSDEDSDLEGRPKNEFSEETIRNHRGRYALKRPPKKDDKTVAGKRPKPE